MITAITILLIALAGFSNAIMDLTKSKSMWNRSIFSRLPQSHWWVKWAGPDSWKNKWKLDENGKPTSSDRFFMSSTVFSWVTDAWHLFQMLWSTFFIVAILIYIPMWGWWGAPLILCYLIEFVILKVVYTGVFNLFFDHVFKKNEE